MELDGVAGQDPAWHRARDTVDRHVRRDIDHGDRRHIDVTACRTAVGHLDLRNAVVVIEPSVERGGVACVMILTDGYENASVRHTASGIRKRVERLRERGWDFRIIGAGINPMEMAQEAGLQLDEIVAFEGDDAEENMRDSLGYMGDYFRNCY